MKMQDIAGSTSESSFSRSGLANVVRMRYLLPLDAGGILLAFALSLLLRYESISRTIDLILQNWFILLIAVVVRIPIYYGFRLYSRLWRYASIQEVPRIVSATLFGSLIMVVLNHQLFPLLKLPFIASFSVFVVDWILNTAFLSASRLLLRIGLNWLTNHPKRRVLSVITRQRRVLIAGAGDMGAVVTRLILDNPEMSYSLVGYVDDDPDKQGKQLNGFQVLGNRHDIPRLAEKHRINEVIVAISTAPESVLDSFREICADAHIPVRVIPSIYDLLAGTLSVDQLRQWRSSDGDHFMRSDDQQPMPVKRPVYHNLLVTGGAGFIGSNFVRYMLETHPNYMIVVYDKLTYAGNPDNLLGLREAYPDRYVFFKGDIADREQVALAMKMYAIDCIVNFAAETHVDRSLMEPDAFLQANVYGTYVLLEAARQFDVCRFHQVSTDEVYGQVLRGSFSEQDLLETRSPYSASKAAADLLAHAYCASFGVPVTITRGSNNIGPYQYPEKALPLFITNALDNLPLPVYGDGLYVRDYQYVLDHCGGIDLVLHQGVPGEIYNLGGGSSNERTALDLAKAVLDHLGKPHSLIHLVSDRPGQDRRYSLNCAKIKALGWAPQWDFDKALDATIQWYTQNEWWWRKIKSGEYRKYYEKQFAKRLEQAVQFVLTEKQPPS